MLPSCPCPPAQTFTRLEMPAQRALLHVNASPAAPRLRPPLLRAALAAAQGSAALAQEQVGKGQLGGVPPCSLPARCSAFLASLISSLLSRRLPCAPACPQVRSIYGMPRLSLDSDDSLMQLLGEPPLA